MLSVAKQLPYQPRRFGRSFASLRMTGVALWVRRGESMSVSAIPGQILLPDSRPAYEVEEIPSAVARWRDSENAVTPRSYYGEVGRRLLRDRSALTAGAILLLIVGSSVLA